MPAPLRCCESCGRDTRAKSGYCSRCLPRRVADRPDDDAPDAPGDGPDIRFGLDDLLDLPDRFRFPDLDE